MIKIIRNILCCSALITLSATSLAEKNNAEGIPLNKLQEFVEIIDQIKIYYAEEVSTDELFEHAMTGMVSSLDPHSAYLNEDDFDDLKISTHGKFGGLGIEVALKDGFVQVIAPIDDTPAAQAGIQSGDIIIRLDNKTIKGLPLREAVNLMRGPEGSTVTLTIMRENEIKPREFKIERAIIKVKNVKSQLLEKHYAYIRITHFQENTAKEMQNVIQKLKKESGGELKGLILDLRNNPGGVLDEAIKVSDTFLEAENLKYDQLIVYTKSRTPQAVVYEKARGKDLIDHAPMVILINTGSASASEIVAGALQDHKRAILLGDTSFGKGSVQTVIPLRDNKGIKLTTAHYYTPSGRSIQETGIEPDIIFEEEKIVHVENIMPNHKTDLLEDEQVSEALQVLKTVNLKLRRS